MLFISFSKYCFSSETVHDLRASPNWMVSLFTMRWTQRFRNHEWIGNRDYKFMCWSSWHRAGAFNKKEKLWTNFSKSSLGRLRTLLTIRTDYRFLTSTKWSLTGSSFGKINLWSSSWKFSKDPFVLVTSLPPQCTIRLFSGVLFIYAPPMKYWVTIDLKIPTFSAVTNWKWWNKSERYDFWGVGIETGMKKAD